MRISPGIERHAFSLLRKTPGNSRLGQEAIYGHEAHTNVGWWVRLEKTMRDETNHDRKYIMMIPELKTPRRNLWL